MKWQEGLTKEDLENIENALDKLGSERKKYIMETEELQDLKEEMADYQEDIEDLRDVVKDSGIEKVEVRSNSSLEPLQS
jgi:LETM1 and EF-hand domain-containing protein 1